MRYNPKAKLDAGQVEDRRPRADKPLGLSGKVQLAIRKSNPRYQQRIQENADAARANRPVGHIRDQHISFPNGVPTQSVDKPDGADVQKSARMKRHGR